MSERPSEHHPEQNSPEQEGSPDHRRSADWFQEKINSYKTRIETDQRSFDQWAESEETRLTNTEFHAIEGLNTDDRHEMVDVRNDLEEKLESNARINEKIAAFADELGRDNDEELKALVRRAAYEREIIDYINNTFPTPEHEDEEDANAQARENARNLLLMPRERFNEITNKWDDLDAINVVRAEMGAEEDEAFATNEAIDAQKAQERQGNLKTGNTTIDEHGAEYKITGVDLDDEGYPKNVSMQITTPGRDGRRARTRSVRYPAKAAAAIFSGPETLNAENETEDNAHINDHEGVASSEPTSEDTPYTDRERAEAAQIAAQVEGEIRDINERSQDRGTTTPEGIHEQIEAFRAQIRELERQKAEMEAHIRARQNAQEGTPDNNGGDTEGEGMGNGGEGLPDQNEGDTETEPQPLRFRDRLRLAATLLRTPDGTLRERINDATNVLLNRDNREQETGERDRRRRIVKWAIGAGAVVLAGGVVWAAISNRDDIGQTLHEYFSGETGGTAVPDSSEAGGGASNVDTYGGGSEGFEFSDAARTAERNEGWWNTITETTGIRNESQLRAVLNDVGPKLVDRGEAFVAPELGGYGISRPGKLSEQSLELIQQSAQRLGYIPR